MENYSVQNYIDDIREIVAKETEEGPITDMIKPLSIRLAANPSWLRDAFRKVDHEQGFGIHLLHEEEDHNLAVFVIAWAPGRGLAAHNHKTWAVVAGIEGQEHETNYCRLDDSTIPGFADLLKTHEETLYPGSAVCCMPEDIHSVWNNGTEIAISLHTYGRHLNHTGRSIFDVDKKLETPCIVNVQE